MPDLRRSGTWRKPGKTRAARQPNFGRPARPADGAAAASGEPVRVLEHVPEKLPGFFDQDMLQLLEFELRPYRSNDSI